MRANILAEQMAENADLIARHLLPDGKTNGREWKVGSLAGEPGDSLGVCLSGLKVGVFCDFATGESGDLLDLWMQARTCSLTDAMREAMAFLGIQDDKPNFANKEKSWSAPKKPSCKKLGTESKVFDYLINTRNLTKETLESFKIADGGDCIVFPYIRDSKPVMIKTLKLERKDGKKDIKPTSANQEPCLFGWQAVSGNSREVALVEGEIDAMSVKQMGLDALSVPFGAGKGQNWIDNEYDRLDRFDIIYIAMDTDGPGEIAREEIIDRLGRHRCKVLNIGGFKDANEALQSGYTAHDLRSDVSTAETCDPDELKKLSYFHDKIMDEFYPKNERQTGATLPWKKTRDQVRLRAGEISVWAGINSHGKSLILSQVMVDCVSQGYRVCIASMEMSPADTGHKMYKQIGGNDTPTKQHADKIKDFVNDGVWIFNLYGTAKAKRILEVFKYAYHRYGIKHFVVDSLAKCGINEDDYNGQKTFIDRLMEFAGEHNIHVHVVIHVRKQGDEYSMPGKMDIKGTGGLTDMVDNLFIIWRNKKREAAMNSNDQKKIDKFKDKPDAYLSVDKQRKTGQEPTFALWFYEKSCQFIESDRSEPTKYIN